MFRIGRRQIDLNVETTIANLLRSGIVLAAAVVLAGGLLYLARHGASTPDYRVFRGEPIDLSSVAGITKDALALQGRGLIQFGILLLIATPVARVALSVLAFSVERDGVYAAVTLIVLVLLLYSLAMGGP